MLAQMNFKIEIDTMILCTINVYGFWYKLSKFSDQDLEQETLKNNSSKFPQISVPKH